MLSSASNAINGTAAGEITKNFYNSLSTAESKESSIQCLLIEANEPFLQNEVNYFLAGAIVASIVTAVVLLVLLILRKRIALVVSLFHEAGKAVHSMPYLVFTPLLTFLALREASEKNNLSHIKFEV